MKERKTYLYIERWLCASVFLLLSAGSLCAQQRDSVYLLEGVQIETKDGTPAVNALVPLQSVDAQTISSLPALQVSDVLKLFSGIVIRDYGGTGGMKTVAVRGFGSQHTAVAYDGILIADGQTGQIDLSRFSLQNAYDVEMVTGPVTESVAPARQAASAGTLFIRTPQPHFTTKKPVNVELRFTGASFGHLNPSIHLENRICEKQGAHPFTISSSLNINYLQSKGNYPFTIHYGGVSDSTSRERRCNSDIKSLTAEENLFFNFFHKGMLQAKFYYYQSERGLPGAVIFYSTKGGQRLYDQNAFGQLHYESHFGQKWDYECNAKISYAKQRYYDSTYLNAAGFLHNRYYQREYYLSNAVGFTPHRLITLSLANDVIFGNMNANLDHFATPSRLQILTAFTAMVNHRQVQAQARLLHTGVMNWAQVGDAGDNLSRFTPAVSISVQPLLNTHWHLRAYYQNIFRLPTFNDLYYNEVGNTNLKPENAHQVNVGTTFARSWKISADGTPRHTVSIELTVDGYYNRVKNKIVAIPSKNLFVWSMFNFGRVEMSGGDLMAVFRYELKESWFAGFSLTGNYSLQRAVDKTTPGGQTYCHQIPYTPLHSGSIATTLRFQWFDIGYTMLWAGERYALQQNVDANLLEPYTDHSLSLSAEHRFRLHRRQKEDSDALGLGVKIEMLNLADRCYEVIRNYPMPGRSYRATIWLKW